MDKQGVVLARFWQQQEKYIYYIVGVSVAAIGFVIVNTQDEPLTWYHLPAGLSIVSWGISIYCGLRFIKYTISNLYANKDLLDVEEGRNPNAGRNPELMKAASSGIRKALKKNEKSMMFLASAQNFFFYSGIVCYLVWHIINMSFNG